MIPKLGVSIVAIAVIALVSGLSDPLVDDDAAVRAVLDEYLSTVAYPDPTPIDPALFATEIEAFWSNGETYRGRNAVVKAMKVGVSELEPDFESFVTKARDVHIHRKGDMAWVACQIDLTGTLNEGRGEFHRTIRSTFVFEKGEERWQMVHEHSSRLRQEVRKPGAEPQDQPE